MERTPFLPRESSFARAVHNAEHAGRKAAEGIKPLDL